MPRGQSHFRRGENRDSPVRSFALPFADDRRPEPFQGGGHHLVAMLQAARTQAPAASASASQSSGSEGLAAVGQDDQIARTASRGGMAAGSQLGIAPRAGQQRRVPQGRPGREQLLGVVFLPLEVEVLQALARQQGDEAVEFMGDRVQGSGDQGSGVRGQGSGVSGVKVGAAERGTGCSSTRRLSSPIPDP